MKQCKCLIFIAFDCHCNHFYPINRKIYEKSFEKLKKNWNQPQNLSKFWDFTSNCQKCPVFFNISEKNSFLNQTIGLKKSFLNQTTYVLKNRLYQQSFLNRDSFLNRAFLNQDSTVTKYTWEQMIQMRLHIWFKTNMSCPD